MIFNSSKGWSAMKPATVRNDSTDDTGKIVSTQFWQSAPVMGTSWIANFNKTKGFRRSCFSVNPVEHVTESTSEFSQLPVFLPSKYNQWGAPLQGTILSGDLAAYVRQYSGVGLDGPLVPQYPTQNSVDSTLVGAYAKLGEAQMDFGMFFAELGETLTMLRKPFSSVRKLFHNIRRWGKPRYNVDGLRRGQPRRKREDFSRSRSKELVNSQEQISSDIFDALSGQWMEYRYGIVPLFKDIESILKLVDDRIADFHEQMMRKVRKEVGPRTQTYKQKTFETLPNQMTCFAFEETRFTEYKLYSKVFYRRTNSVWHQLNALGLNPASAGSLMWELVPLSFVVDWFVNVGDWLKAIAPHPGIDVIGNTVTLAKFDTSVIKLLDATYSTYANRYPWIILGGASYQTRKSVVRQVNLPLPTYPPLEMEALNLKQQIDSLSLIWQNLPKILLKR